MDVDEVDTLRRADQDNRRYDSQSCAARCCLHEFSDRIWRRPFGVFVLKRMDRLPHRLLRCVTVVLVHGDYPETAFFRGPSPSIREKRVVGKNATVRFSPLAFDKDLRTVLRKVFTGGLAFEMVLSIVTASKHSTIWSRDGIGLYTSTPRQKNCGSPTNLSRNELYECIP